MNKIDINEFKRGLYSFEKKGNNFTTDLGAGISGVGKAMSAPNAPNPMFHPLDAFNNAYEGLTSGALGSVAGRKLAPLEHSGVSLQKDQYGIPTGVNAGETALGLTSHALGGLGNSLNNMGSTIKGWWNTAQQPGGIPTLMNQFGTWAQQHQTPLLGGAAVLGGGYLLHKLLSGGNNQQPQQPMPYGYPAPYPYYMPPQSFQKAAGMSFGLKPMEAPRAIAAALTGGIGTPGMADARPIEKMRPPSLSYEPSFHTADPRLKHALADPKMQGYLKNLIEQVNGNSNIK